MKCWECKKQVNRVMLVHYFDGLKEATRDVCFTCYSKLQFNPCHYVEVERITRRQLLIKGV